MKVVQEKLCAYIIYFKDGTKKFCYAKDPNAAWKRAERSGEVAYVKYAWKGRVYEMVG